MPLYLKSHSWGEFVFDRGWAEAYRRQGLDYYPKLLCAVPFTPVSGPRLLAPTPELRAELLRGALRLAQEWGASSLHCLFPTQAQAEEMQAHGMMLRQGVQFHWRNPGYADFDAYLAGMSHDKRKRIKQERRKVREAGIAFERLSGAAISDAHWTFFEHCYAETHRQYQAPPALNLDFFRRIAAALNFHYQEALYGRSWGTLEYHPRLHFETCYYLLHRTPHPAIRRRRPRRTQAVARLPPRNHLVGALAGPPALRAGRGRFFAARDERDEFLYGRA